MPFVQNSLVSIIPSFRRKRLIKAVFIDIDDTVFSFSGFVKKAMCNGFEKFGLKPYTDEMYPYTGSRCYYTKDLK